MNQLLREHGFDGFAEAQGATFCADVMSRPGLPSGIYVRLLLIGLDSSRDRLSRASRRFGRRDFRRHHMRVDDAGRIHAENMRSAENFKRAFLEHVPIGSARSAVWDYLEAAGARMSLQERRKDPNKVPQGFKAYRSVTFAELHGRATRWIAADLLRRLHVEEEIAGSFRLGQA